MKHLIVIDDTSSPGNFNESVFLKENRKTLVAVFIHYEIRKALEEDIKGIVKILNNQFSIKRLHFKDLINKNNEYKDLENEDVIFIMDELSHFISQIDLPYLVQSCNSNTLKENGIYIKDNLEIDNLNLKKNDDAALFLLIIRIKKFIEENYPNDKIEIIMDRGRKKTEESEEFGILKGLSNSKINYKSSVDFQLLQIADYFAYSINRMQMTAIKEQKTDFDIKILKFISIALENQFSDGITPWEVADPKKITKDDYDYEQYKQRQIDGNLNKWKISRK